MVDNLAGLFVPQLDGGIFDPLISYGSLLLTNYSNTLFNPSAADGNASVPTLGSGLTGWFLGRAASQAAQFAGAAAWLLLTLAALVIAVALTTRRARLPFSPYRRDKKGQPASLYAVNHANSSLSSSPAPSSDPLNSARSRSRLWWPWRAERKREQILTLRLALLIAAFVICTATLGVYWHYSGGYGYGQLFQRQQVASSDGGNGSSGSSGSLSGAVNSAVFRLNSFIEDTLRSTNTSVLEVCYDALPSILALVNRIATRYLDLLSLDFKLTDLLNVFDEFIRLVKMLLGSMNAIKDSRDSVFNPLNSFTTVINRTRDDLRTKVADVCAGSPTNGVPVALCSAINSHIRLLTIGLDYRQIDSDSSVTIVTLLDKIFKLNVSEVESQVNSAKSLLTSSLSLIGNEITNLFNSLVSEVSKQFQGALAGANSLRSDMLNATQSDAFVGAFATGDAVLQSISAVIVIVYCLTLVCTAGIAIVLVYFYYQRRKWETARSNMRMGGTGPPADSMAEQQPEGRPPLRSLTSIVEVSGETLKNQKQQSGAEEWRRYNRMNRGMQLMKTNPMIYTMFALGTSFAIMFAFGFALLYAGSEIQRDACRYMSSPAATAVVDAKLNRLMDDALWPAAQQLLAEKVSIPLPLTKSMLPKGLLGVLLRDCKNASVTIFQIYNLVNAFDLTDLLKTKEVRNELYKGREMVEKMVGDLNVSTLIPSQVDSILAVLPEFANIIDTQDYSASISELAKPLLTIGNQMPVLLGELQAMVRILLDRNPSDDRAILIRHFGDNLNLSYTVDYPALNRSLVQMRQHFLTLQNNRVVLIFTRKLTDSLAGLKTALSNKTALLTAVAARYDEVLTEYTPELAASLNSLLAKILTKVGHCSGISAVLGTVVTECDGSLAALPYGGFYVALSSALLVLLCIAAMPVLRAARWHKRAAAEQQVWENSRATSSQTLETQDGTTV